MTKKTIAINPKGNINSSTKPSDKKKNKSILITSLLSCSLMGLAGVGILSFLVIKSCNKTPSPTPTPIQTDSYYTLADDPDTEYYFGETNTPISSFYGGDDWYSNSSIIINGSSVLVNDICSLSFGDSYGNVSSISSSFIDGHSGGFSSLTSIDFSGLSSLKSVGDFWMNGYGGGFSSLSSIDFSGLGSLSSVGDNWMYGSEQGIDNGMANVTTIYVGNVNFKEEFSTTGFCSNFPVGKMIDADSYDISKTWQVGGLSSWNADKLSYYTTSSDSMTPIYFDNANTPISNFCVNSDNLTINTSSVAKDDIYQLNFGNSYGGVNVINNNFIYGETGKFKSLVSIDFSGLSSLSSVGDSWMDGYGGSFSSLSSINFTGLENLKQVGIYWMYGCSLCFNALTTLNFNGLSSLESVGEKWMWGAFGPSFSSLSSIDLSGLSSLTTVGDYWMSGQGQESDDKGFLNIKSIYVGGVLKPTNLGNNFCQQWKTDGTIYADTNEIASSWKVGGLANWTTEP